MNNTSTLIKQQLRQSLRSKRAGLPLEEQQVKAEQLMLMVKKCPKFLSYQSIAAYWPIEGEINPLPLLKWADSIGKRCYLPVLHPPRTRELQFVEYKPEDLLKPNRFGIPEPIFKEEKSIPAWRLNLIFVPLVAFDQNGRRLGRGAGHYDQAFSFLKTNSNANLDPQKPALWGLAYDWQCVEELPEDPWDVLLNGIITEKRCIAMSE